MKTERIILRPWLDSDAGTLFKYASDPEVGPRAGWPPHKSVEESLEIIRTVFNNDRTWAIELKETGALLRYSGGDARKLLNILELVASPGPSEGGESCDPASAIVITDQLVEATLQQNPLAYDKEGEICDIQVYYGEDYAHQMLRYSQEYGTLI